MRITVYIFKQLESLPDTTFIIRFSNIYLYRANSTIQFTQALETLPDTLSLSLTGIRLSPKQARRVNDSTASLSLAERWTITEIHRQSNSVLTYSLLTDVLPNARV